MKDVAKTKLRRDDNVVVISGREKGKSGRVLRIDREHGRVLVEGVNMVKKAQKRKSQNESGGIIEIEAPIDLSNVMLAGKDGKPTRIGYKVTNGTKVRVAKKTGEDI